jgi:hypothetical protein
VLLSKRSKERIDSRIRELTPRTWGRSLQACILLMNVYLRGWMGFFGICTAGVEQRLGALDAHIRRRLRAIQLQHWRCKRTIARRLILLGGKRATVWRSVYEGRKSFWALSHAPSIDRALRKGYWTERGLLSLADLWRASFFHRVVAPQQLTLRWDTLRS